MSPMKFHTASKGYLPHYSYIFRKLDPLGTKMKTMACSRLGTMLHLEIQNGKEAMKKYSFQKYIRGNASFIKKLMIATKGVAN